jgi:hypothetical protein
MRSSLRSLLSAAALAVAALLVAASAVFASTASPGRFTVDDAWCFDDVVLQYCFDQHYTVQFVDFADGDGWVKITGRATTDIYRDGVLVGTSRTVSNDRSVYVDGGQANLHTVEHTRSSFDGETCVITTVLRITDFEVVLDKWNGPGCG